METRSNYSLAKFDDRKSFVSESKYLASLGSKLPKNQEFSSKLANKNKAALSLYSASRFDANQTSYDFLPAATTVKFSERCSRIQRHVDDIAVSFQTLLHTKSNPYQTRRAANTRSSNSRSTK